MLATTHVVTTGVLPTERRAHRRFTASELPGIRARVKYGQEVSVIDLSSGGVLFQTSEELQPNSTIVLEFSGATRTFLVPSRVLRCHDLGTFDHAPRLEGACAFRRPLPIEDLVSDAVRHRTTAAKTPVRGNGTWAGWQIVVGKYRDGSVVRGYTNDFNPLKPYLHVSPTPFSDETKFVSMIHLDALFFPSDPHASGSDDWDPMDRASAARGRKVAMTLPDGKELLGTTLTYSRDGNGFFVRPLDTHSGTARVFITQNGIRSIRFL
jgi:hypothetical protein